VWTKQTELLLYIYIIITKIMISKMYWKQTEFLLYIFYIAGLARVGMLVVSNLDHKKDGSFQYDIQ
jgi:hypothetical protein